MIPFSRWLRRHRSVIFMAVVLCFVLAGMTGACGAYRRPIPPSDGERRLLESTPIPYDVSVVPWTQEAGAVRGQDPDAYAHSLATLLKASGAFRSSRFDPRHETDADLSATSTGIHCNSAVIPIWSILSLGIVPTVTEDEYCEGMVLRSARTPSSSSVEIEIRHKGTVVMGWFAIPLGFLPGWSHGDMEDDSRYRERFRLSILRRRAEIERLVERGGEMKKPD